MSGPGGRNSACVEVQSTCRLTSCTLSSCSRGLSVIEEGSAHASNCYLLRNEYGACAVLGASPTAISCSSSNCMETGFTAEDDSSLLELRDCVSDEDGAGCVACDGAMLRATRVAVTRSERAGYTVYEGARAVLQDCSAKASGGQSGDDPAYCLSLIHI